MNKKPNPGSRRFYHPPRRGPMHVSAGIAHAAANFYFRLERGTAAQRKAAEEWRSLFMEIPRLLNS